MTFAELSTHSTLLAALTERGYQQPTPVQAAILNPALRGRDLVVSAQTGSGKTVAFGLALADELLGDATRLPPAGMPAALVIAPTRELALQVQRELAWLYAGAGARVRACVGGMDPRAEQRALADGAHIVVGTPGRLCDHLDRRNLKLSALRSIVLDEADEMLDMGFRDDLERILKAAPEERRTLMFSATIPTGIAELAARYQFDAVRVAATPPEQAHADIEYRAYLIAPREREHAVVNTLRALDPAGALVFCATREAVNHLQASLAERGFEAVAISGELTQAERVRALKALRDGRARVLVATDVAARGLDLPALDLVIHADLPRDPQVLQHRSGRTGRAGRKGISVLLVPAALNRVARRMLQAAKVQARWSSVPTAEEIHALDQARLVRDIEAMCAENGEQDLAVARQLLEQLSPEALVSALVRERRSRLPAPEEMPETARAASGVKERTERRPLPAARPARKRVARSDVEDGVWFRLNVGRLKNADPRWLVPLICRRGGVVKPDIGRIQILPKETRFLIAAEKAERFERAARRPDTKDPAIRIELVRA